MSVISLNAIILISLVKTLKKRRDDLTEKTGSPLEFESGSQESYRSSFISVSNELDYPQIKLHNFLWPQFPHFLMRELD